MNKLRNTIITLVVALVMAFGGFPSAAFAKMIYNNEGASGEDTMPQNTEYQEPEDEEPQYQEPQNQEPEYQEPAGNSEDQEPTGNSGDDGEDESISPMTNQSPQPQGTNSEDYLKPTGDEDLVEEASEEYTLTVHFMVGDKELETLTPMTVKEGDPIDYTNEVASKTMELQSQDIYKESSDILKGTIGTDIQANPGSNSIDLYVRYKEVPLTVTFKYVDINDETKELKESKIEPLEYGQYDFTNSKPEEKEIDNYNFVKVSDDVKGEILKDTAKEISATEAQARCVVVTYYYEEGSSNLDSQPKTRSTEEEQEELDKSEDKKDPEEVKEDEEVKDITVTFNYYDEMTSEKIAESETIYMKSNEKIVNKELAIDGYKFNYSQEIPKDNGDYVINSYYRKVDLDGQYSITVNYLEVGSNKVLADQFVSMKVPSGYKYDISFRSSLNIPGYEYVKTEGEVFGTVNDQDIVINIYYKKVPLDIKVTFNYYDELSSKKIAKSEVKNMKSDEKISIIPLEIEGYKFKYSEERTLANGDKVVNLYYYKIDVVGQYRVIINYLEEGSNKVLADQFVSIKIPTGYTYDVSCRDKLSIPGYKYVKTVGNVTGTVEEKDIVINVYYRKVQQYRVTINYLNYNNKKSIYKSFVSIKLNEGDYYNVTKYNALKINGYNYYKTVGDPLKGYIDGNKVINVYYLKNGETAVKTGDNNNILLWITVGLIGIIVVAVVVIIRRKSSDK